ncbi:MAG TPA: ADOP family duplicated permease [Acidobacteriota bacterium]|nr:ADOP family duplicated permease [Acidobacteriota bacterium]
MTPESPPRIWQGLLRRILPRDWRTDVMGDLEAGWRKRAELGSRQAAVWYRRQALGYLLRIPRLAAKRLRVRFSDAIRFPRQGRSRAQEGWMISVVQDIRMALRSLGRHPGFTLIVVLTLSLGIGANTAVFSLTDAVLLRSLPVRDPDSLVAMAGRCGDGRVSISYPVFTEMAERQDALIGLFADCSPGLERARMDGRRLSDLRVASVSGNYFQLLGVRPRLGRLLTPEDDQRGASGGVAVASHTFWSTRLGGDESALGRVIEVDGSPFTIVGVAPPEFFGARVGARADLWLPINRSVSESSLDWRTGTFFNIMGRLKPGVSLQQAQESLSALFRHVLEADSKAGRPTVVREDARVADHRVLLDPARNGFDALRSAYSMPLKVLTLATALALLIVCFNVANLMLARAASRGREMATRLALGAGRLRLARQLTLESLLLGVTGGLGGLLIAWTASPFIASFIASPEDAALLYLKPDPRVLGYALAASLITGLLFGLAPVVWSALRDPGTALGSARSEAGMSRPRLRFAKGLLVAQIALSLLLLSGAGLMLGSLQELAAVPLGFQQQSLAVASASFEIPRERRNAFRLSLEERLKAVPGVRSASASWLGVFTRSDMGANLEISGYKPAPDESTAVRLNTVTPSYLETMGVPLRAGRPILPSDNQEAPKVALVNQAFADRYFAGRSPLGATFRMRGDDADVEIVGVTGNFLWNDLRAENEPIFLLPATQWGMEMRSIQVRLEVPYASVAGPLRKAIEGLDESTLVRDVHLMSEQVDSTIRSERMLAHLSGWFAGLGTLMACLGIYGILSYSVQRRRREMGVRLAVGAQRRGILTLVLREAAVLLILGLPLGLAGSWAASRTVSSFLYGVAADDFAVHLAVVVLLAAVTLLAALLPACRAASLDPARILRCE